MRKFSVISLILVLFLSMSFVIAQDTTPIIEVTLLNHDPDPVKQGDVVEVRFKIENTGTETAGNVEVQILPDYPFTLYSGTSTINLGKLRAEQSGSDAVILGYKLKVDEEGVEGDNEIELEIRVGEGIWRVYDEDEFLIDIEDYDFPEIKAYIKESSITSAGQKGEVVVEIVNTNLEDVKFLQLTLTPSADYELLSSSNYVYIGDVDSDDTESEEFEIYVNKGIGEFLLLPIQLEYQDTNGLEYNKNFILKLRLFDDRESKKFGLKKDNKLGIGIAVLIILVLGYYIYWRKKRK